MAKIEASRSFLGLKGSDLKEKLDEQRNLLAKLAVK